MVTKTNDYIIEGYSLVLQLYFFSLTALVLPLITVKTQGLSGLHNEATPRLAIFLFEKTQ